MKQLLKVTVLLVMVALLAAPVVAQEKEKKQRKKGDQQRGVAASLMERLETVNLTEPQKAKVKEVVAKFEPKLKELTDALKPTPEQREAVAAARKKAEAEGKKGKDLRAAVDAAVKPTEKQLELRKKLQTAQQELQKAVTALLTPEQAKAFAAAGKKAGESDKTKDKGGKKRKKTDK